MKKVCVSLALMLTTIASFAWEVGDFYVDSTTGVPSIVAYVDESGEHGLLMSPELLSEKDLAATIKQQEKNAKFAEKMADKYAAKSGVDMEAYQQGKEMAGGFTSNPSNITVEFLEHFPTFKDWKSHNKGHKANIFNKYIDELAAGNTEYGQSNTTAINEYCIENNVDVELYFPAVSYANRLGEGWFVPGNYELELISKNFIDNVGEKEKMKSTEISKRKSAIRIKILNIQPFFPILDPLRSSTMIKSSWTESNKDKISKILSTGSGLGVLGQAIVLTVSAAEKDTYYTLLEMQKKVDVFNEYYAFCRNADYGYIICVKKF